jgi:hypothetical protein
VFGPGLAMRPIVRNSRMAVAPTVPRAILPPPPTPLPPTAPGAAPSGFVDAAAAMQAFLDAFPELSADALGQLLSAHPSAVERPPAQVGRAGI